MFFVTKTHISEFREAVYQKVVWRPAAILDLVDALTIAGHVSSPVALSDSPLFRRKFSSVYVALVHGELGDDLKTLFSDSQAADAQGGRDAEEVVKSVSKQKIAW